MFYRVDYAFSLMLAGAIFGWLLSRRTAGAPRERMARDAYVVVAVLVSATVLAAVSSQILQPSIAASLTYGIGGDLLKCATGFLLGLAARWPERRAFLTSTPIVGAYVLMLVFTFALSGSLNALGFESMLKFFTRSGYSSGFLKFILLGEIFGAIGLLLRWARGIACVGLIIDMFGAVLTHIHNGDSLNDSTGAIVALCRFAILSVLWFLIPTKRNPSPKTTAAFARTLAVFSICLAAAFVGSVAARHFGVVAPVQVP